MNGFVRIRDVLVQQDEYGGWLYLTASPWSLETQGVFVKEDKDADPNSDAHVPDIVKRNGWAEVLDAASIEDIVLNAKVQIAEPSEEDLFEAFNFYVDNDAFMDFMKEN